MFNKKEIKRLSSEVGTLSVEVNNIYSRMVDNKKEYDNTVKNLSNDIIKLKNDTQEKLVMFYKEITDKYLNTLEKISQEREKSLIANLENNVIKTNEITQLKVDVKEQLTKFYKEMVEKQFNVLEKTLQDYTESSIVKALTQQTDKKDLGNLKSVLIQPFLEAKWEKEKQEKGERIINKGEVIITERKRLYEEILQREKKSEDVSKLKEQLKSFDWILEVVR